MTLGNCPSFSIVIPTFQRRDVLVDAVKSLARCKYAGAIEMIVVVDGSTDGSAAALEILQLPFPLKIIQQTNLGPAAARNRGATQATFDVILFLDDDMMADPDLIDQHARTYREGADAVIGHIPIDPLSPPGFLTASVTKWIAASRVGSELTPFDIFTGQLSVRRSVFNKLGGFDEACTSGGRFAHEDTDLGVRLLARCDVRYNPQAISRQRYIVRPRDIMRRSSAAAVSDLRFAARHPQYAQLLFHHRRASSRRVRYLYRPLSHIPLIPKVTAEVAICTAELFLASPFRSSSLARRFFGFAQGLSYWSAMRANDGVAWSSELLVLCYHAIEDQSHDPVLAPYGIPPREFARHLEWLIDRGSKFVTPDDLFAFLEHGFPLPRRAVLLTFDDCYAGLVEVAERMLQPRGIKAIAFAVTGMESGTNEWDQEQGSARLKLLDGEGLLKLRSLGVEIGCHSRTHREMPLLTNEELQLETRGGAADLESKGLPRPRFFAYPYGSRDDRAMAAVQKAGYFGAFGLSAKHITRESDRYDLPRVSLYAYDKGWRFRARVLAPRTVSKLELLRRRVGGAARAMGKVINGAR